MNEEERVDNLVRGYLQQQEQRTDAQAGLQRVRASLARRPVWSALTRGAGLAAAVVLLAVGMAVWYAGSAQGREEALVRAALAAHAQPVDRCYLVETGLEPTSLEQKYPAWAAARQMRLWTRGDRFWVEVQGLRFSWSMGADPEGGMWLALNSQRGLRFNASDAPETLAHLCDLCSMRVETLLGDVLADFELRSQGAEPGIQQITAELKPGRSHATLRSAVLDIDPETKVLKRVVLTRSVRSRSPSAVSFTLIDTQTLDDARYQLEGHLTAPYQVFSSTVEPERRRQLLIGRFGQRVLDRAERP